MCCRFLSLLLAGPLLLLDEESGQPVIMNQQAIGDWQVNSSSLASGWLGCVFAVVSGGEQREEDEEEQQLLLLHADRSAGEKF